VKCEKCWVGRGPQFAVGTAKAIPKDKARAGKVGSRVAGRSFRLLGASEADKRRNI